MKQKKKGQIRMIETILVLLVLVFLMGFVMIFYARFQFFEIDKVVAEIDEQRANSYLNKVLSMPEVRCSLSFGSASEINCIDTYKLLAFSQPGIRINFADEFSRFSEVRIERIDIANPSFDKKGDECLSARDMIDNECKHWVLFKDESRETRTRAEFETFATLCTQTGSSLYDCEIGRLIIGVPQR